MIVICLSSVMAASTIEQKELRNLVTLKERTLAIPNFNKERIIFKIDPAYLYRRNLAVSPSLLRQLGAAYKQRLRRNLMWSKVQIPKFQRERFLSELQPAYRQLSGGWHIDDPTYMLLLGGWPMDVDIEKELSIIKSRER